MPELPEVELAAQQLRRWLDRIDEVRVSDPRILREVSAEGFVAALHGRQANTVERRGKHLLVDLGGGRAWWIHLGMSGRLARRESFGSLPKATRWAVRSGDAWVGLVDPRVFGRTTAGGRAFVETTAGMDRLGPDALAIGEEALARALRRTRRAAKTALMDQGLIAGLGNIQVAEALFRAGIHPARRASTLDTAEVAALWKGIRGTLEDTLRDLEEESFGDDGSGEVTYMSDGDTTNPFDVYGREGEPCPRCQTPIARIVQGGRSTFFCPECQPEPS